MSAQQTQPPPRYKHWELFLILENELQTISRYVEIHPDNDDTYSLEIASLLVRCCGEIEKLARKITGLTGNENIDCITIKLVEVYSDFPTFPIDFPIWGLLNQAPCPIPDLTGKKPKLKFTGGKWWKAHNDIKHGNNNGSLAPGNLKNCLCAFSALYITTLYFERHFFSVEGHKKKVIVPSSMVPQLIWPSNTFNNIANSALWGQKNFIYSWS